jgi:ribosomal protein L11 methylase PrmA
VSSLEISRRLTFFSFSLNTQNQALEVYSFFCCEEVNEEDDKEDTTKSKTQTNETERRVEKTLLLFLSLPNNSASAYEHVFVFPNEKNLQDREEIFISEKRDEQRWAKTRRKGRRPRLPPPLRRFRRQKRRVLRRRKATTIQTTANL